MKDPLAYRLGDRLHPYTAQGLYGRFFEGKATVDFKNLLNLFEFEELNEKIPYEEPVSLEISEIQLEKLKKTIQQLPDGYRVVLSLYLLEGYDHEEIAQILGISNTSSRSQYLRAKLKLRQILHKEELFEYN
jgi:RNA polymerase sigma factor (sigma-70 family)